MNISQIQLLHLLGVLNRSRLAENTLDNRSFSVDSGFLGRFTISCHAPHGSMSLCMEYSDLESNDLLQKCRTMFPKVLATPVCSEMFMPHCPIEANTLCDASGFVGRDWCLVVPRTDVFSNE